MRQELCFDGILWCQTSTFVYFESRARLFFMIHIEMSTVQKKWKTAFACNANSWDINRKKQPLFLTKLGLFCGLEKFTLTPSRMDPSSYTSDNEVQRHALDTLLLQLDSIYLLIIIIKGKKASSSKYENNSCNHQNFKLNRGKNNSRKISMNKWWFFQHQFICPKNSLFFSC